MKRIGKGSFTTAYLQDDGHTALLKSTDYIKECMAHGWFPESALFPIINFTDTPHTYTMEYYPKVKSLKDNLDPDQYLIYKQLRALLPCAKYCSRPHDYHAMWHTLFDTLPSDLKEVMKEALDACANYGTDVQFEISPRNVATKNGRLILLDCFFIQSQLDEVRKCHS